MMNNNNSYDDIINLPRHVSKNRKQMLISDRAAQFAPFSALTGYHESIEETARVTMNKPRLSQEMKDLISMKLGYLKECKDEFVSVKHFIKDRKKDGGMVKISSGLVKRVDEYEQVIVFIDNQKIRIDDIIDIKSENIDLVFSNFGI